MAAITAAVVLLAATVAAREPSSHCYSNLSDVFYHDTKTLQVWQLSAINPVLVRTHLMNDTSGMSDALIAVNDWQGYFWNITTTFPPSATIYSGRLEQSNGHCTSIALHATNGHTVFWSPGPKPAPAQACHFDNAPFYSSDSSRPSYEWADTLSLTTLNHTAFEVRSLNGTLGPTMTATITAVAGYSSVGNLSSPSSAAASGLQFALDSRGAEGQPSLCTELTTFPAGLGWDRAKSITWNAGPPPVPSARPCETAYSAEDCATAWMNKCAWCSSSDAAHHLCFNATQAKLLPHDQWACV